MKIRGIKPEFWTDEKVRSSNSTMEASNRTTPGERVNARTEGLTTEVLRRDNHACRYCGGVAPDMKLTVDHVLPVALGGSDDPSNLVTACKDCNSGKTSTSPSESIVEDVSADAARWARAITLAAERASEKRSAEEEYFELFRSVWTDRLPADWRSSVGALRAAGLPRTEVVDVARIASTSRSAYDPFSYFCGICWKRVRAMQVEAQGIIDRGEVE